jgi:hypothetical protein
MAEPACVVVLDDEGTRGGRRCQDGRVPVEGEHRRVRVGEGRLQVGDGGAGGGEGPRELIRRHAPGIGRDRDRDDPGGPRDRHCPGVGGHREEHRGAGTGQGANGGTQRGLATGGDEDVVGIGAGLVGEPRAQFGTAARRRRTPHPGPARGAAHRRSEPPLRLERGVGERRGQRQQVRPQLALTHPLQRRGVDLGRAEGDLMPDGVPGRRPVGAGGTELLPEPTS